MSEVRLSGDEMMPILEMIQSMQAKGTFRSRVFSDASKQVGIWLNGFGAQIAVSKFLEDECHVSTKIDTRAYDDVSADSGDLWKVFDSGEWKLCEPVEIKKIPSYGNHVAITEGEAEQIDAGEPIVIVQSDWEPDVPSENRREWLLDQQADYEVVGWCTKDDLSWTKKGVKPWTQNADNLCQPISQLNTDWYELCEQLHPDVSPTKFTFSSD